MKSNLHRVLYFAVFLLMARSALAQTSVITTVAGSGTAGYSGDGGPATSAGLKHPSEVAIDRDGNFYIADRDNNRVRKVDINSGAITTVAGNGLAGWFFEGGPAKLASLDRPSGVVVDAAGNLYIADLLDNGISRVHKVSAATANINKVDIPVTLKGAVAIALDSNGNLYIAEEDGNRIRKFSLDAGTLTTVVGTGVPGFTGDGGPATSAQIHKPAHLAIDSAGNLYFSDSLNNRIRKVTAATGIISTVAGSGPVGGPGGLAGDGGPATAAQLNNPRGVDVDANGDVFIADTLNKRIRKVNAGTGVITTIAAAANGAECTAALAAFKSPESVTVNAAGTFIYIADGDGNRVWTVTIDTSTPPPALTSITPPNGAPGTSPTVTLAGTGFFAGVRMTPGSACRFTGTAVFVSGAGVSVSNVNVISDTELSATLVIAPDATPGPRDVTVTTDGGTSAPSRFTVAIPALPPPALTSISPASAVEGSSATLTLTGANFDTRPGSTTVSAGGSGISISQISVTSATSLTATFTIARDAALGNHSVIVTTAGGSSNALPLAIYPQGPTFVFGIPKMLNPTEQTPIKVGLMNALPNPVTSKLTLSFVPNASSAADDPNVMFINSQTSTRTVNVTFPANDATAQFSLPSGVLQAGTVAGAIELAMSDVKVGGIDVTSSSTADDVQIPRLVPVITNVRLLNRASSGFDVEVTGYSTTREIAAATFSFGASTGANLLTVQLKPDVTSSFSTYYQSESSTPAGGAFVYNQHFIIKQGDVNAVASVTVTLNNAVGESLPRTAQ